MCYTTGMKTLVLLLLSLTLSACGTVCPTGWEASTSVGHSMYFGPTYEATTTVSGAIGKECRGTK